MNGGHHGLRSAMTGRLAFKSAVAAIAGGALVVILTPFVFFPEIMGDIGVAEASPLRNVAALVVLGLALWSIGTGLLSLARWQADRHVERRAPARPTRSPRI